MTRVVLFDIDGTLLASGGVGRRAFEGALHALIGSRGAAEYRYDGKTDRQIGRDLMRMAGHADEAIDAMMDQLLGDYLLRLQVEIDRGAAGVRVHAGIRELLDALDARGDVMLGLLTGNIVQGAELKLGAAGIGMNRFRVGAYGSDHELRPELPAIAQQRASELLGYPVEGPSVVIIGDTPADVQCGRGIGARAVAVATGHYSVADLQAHQPHAVFADFSDLDAAVAAICDA